MHDASIRRPARAARSVVLLLVLLASPPLLRAEKFPDEYRAGNLLGFASFLIDRGEYYRARTELRRIESLYPGKIPESAIRVSELYCLFRGKRYRELVEEKRATEAGAAACAGLVFSFDAACALADATLAASLLPSHADPCPNEFELFLWKRRFLSAIASNDPGSAALMLEGKDVPLPDGMERQRFENILNYGRERLSSISSPSRALWAGIVPGAGYAYAGNAATGIVAFVVVTVLSSVTYAAFRTDNRPLGVVFGAAATFFYGGSVAGGYLESRRRNRLVMESMLDNIADDARLADDRERLYRDYGIGSLKKK
jgi:hypothetical protein